MTIKFFLLITFVSVMNVGCASERLYVRVTDNEGKPVSNAVVRVGFSTSNVLSGGGHSSRSKSGYAEAKTDTEGNAVVKFNCKNASFGWDVEADGYYRSNSRREQFKFDEVIVPPCFVKVVLHEHEKHGSVILWKKKNPQPMYAHGDYYEEDLHEPPKDNGRYGFDMMKYDWLPPYGKGEVADFYFVRQIGEPVSDGVWGKIVFPNKSGIYIGKQTGCKSFPSTYQADTNAVFKSNIPFIFNHTDKGEKGISFKDIINAGEYGVMRTRVVCDDDGNVVKANYSKVLGPFRFGEWCGKWVLYTPGAVFNPRVNDSNLESDPKRSYDPKLKRPLLAP